MDNAGVIFINKKENNIWNPVPVIIKTSSFKPGSIKYNAVGIITGFIYEVEGVEKEYVCQEVRLSSPQNNNKIIGRGVRYYNKDSFREFLYLSENKSWSEKKKREELLKVERFRDSNFTLAEINDNVLVIRQELTLDSIPKFCKRPITWVYNDLPILLTSPFGEIELPEEANLGVEYCNLLEDGADFFNIQSLRLFNGEIVTNSNPNSIEKIHKLIASIALLIDRISIDVFNAYIGENPILEIANPPFVDSIEGIINLQLQNFVNPLRYNLVIIDDFENLYTDLFTKYNVILNNLYIIENGSDLEKISSLLLTLDVDIINQVSVERRIEIIKFLLIKIEDYDSFILNFLEYLYDSATFQPVIGYDSPKIKQGLAKLYQELIVKLCGAFDESHLLEHSNGDSHIDVFLTNLLSSYDNTGNIILFQAIYDKMNVAWNITETFISATNWVNGTDYKPNDSRGAFVQTLYVIWEFSKFNPYNIDSTLKPLTIGISTLDTDSASFNYSSPEDQQTNENSLLQYTYQVAYESYTTIETDGLGNSEDFILYRDKFGENSTPITIPYDSVKGLGGLFNDNFTFKFKGKKIKAYRSDLPTGTSYDTDYGSFDRTYSDLLYGTYDFFQPVTMINTNIDTKSPLYTVTGDPTEIGGTTINSFVPVFVLKHIDDEGDSSDTEKILGFLVDGVLTFSGIGNLTKLRHLRWLALGASEVSVFSKTGLRVILGSMQGFINAFQLGTGAIQIGDTLTSAALSIRASRIIDIVGGNTEEAIRQNIRQRLINVGADGTDPVLDEVVTSLILYSTPVHLIIRNADDLLKGVIKKIQDIRFKHFRLTDDLYANKGYLKSFVQKCYESDITDLKTMEDLIYIANRGKKPIKPNDLLIRVQIFKIYKDRGYTAGFENVNDYINFSNSFRNTLFIKMDDWIDGFDSFYSETIRFKVKGSAANNFKTGDPDLPENLNNNLSNDNRPVDDIDIDIEIDQYDELLSEITEKLYRDLSQTEIRDLNNASRKLYIDGEGVIDKIEKGRLNSIKYTEMKLFDKFLGTNTVYDIRESCVSFTKFPDPPIHDGFEKINFAFIKPKTSLDRNPKIPFKFN